MGGFCKYIVEPLAIETLYTVSVVGTAYAAKLPDLALTDSVLPLDVLTCEDVVVSDPATCAATLSATVIVIHQLL